MKWSIEDFERVLFFGVHVDDVIIGAGGTIARRREANKKTFIVTYTTGATAAQSQDEQQNMVDQRKNEARIADEILGVTERFYMDKSSQDGIKDRQTYWDTIKLIRHYKPDLIITHSPDEYHPDHNVAARIVPLAAQQAAEEIREKDLGDAWYTPQVWQFEVQGLLDKPEFIVDVSKFYEKKLAAMRTQRSQTRDGFLEHLIWTTEGKNRARAPIGVKYVEAFKKVGYPTLL